MPICNKENCPEDNLAKLGYEYDPEHCIFRCRDTPGECHNSHNKEFSWNDLKMNLEVEA